MSIVPKITTTQNSSNIQLTDNQNQTLTKPTSPEVYKILNTIGYYSKEEELSDAKSDGKIMTTMITVSCGCFCLLFGFIGAGIGAGIGFLLGSHLERSDMAEIEKKHTDSLATLSACLGSKPDGIAPLTEILKFSTTLEKTPHTTESLELQNVKCLTHISEKGNDIHQNISNITTEKDTDGTLLRFKFADTSYAGKEYKGREYCCKLTTQDNPTNEQLKDAILYTLIEDIVKNEKPKTTTSFSYSALFTTYFSQKKDLDKKNV